MCILSVFCGGLFIALLHFPVDFSICVALCDRIALIVHLLASAKTKFYLDVRILEIKRQRDQRHALLCNESVQLHDLALVHKKLATAQGVTVEDIAVLVGAYMHTDNEKLAVLDVAVGVLEVDTSCANALDLGTEKLDASLIFFLNEIVVVRLFVLRCDLDSAVFVRHECSSSLLFFCARDIIHYFEALVKAFFVAEKIRGVNNQNISQKPLDKSLKMR